jgi:FkbM family methyltransferase
MKPRLHLRKLLFRFGYDLHRMPVASLTLRDLEFDLPNLAKNRSPVVIDVGANEGQTIDLICRTLTNPTIFSFEPNPDLVPRLNDKYASSGVVVEGVALGNTEGSVAFNVLENTELSSILTLKRAASNPFSETSVRRQVSVPVTRLDSYCQRQSLRTIDLLKIDTQGFDLEVLKGASMTLSRKAIDTILVEVNFADLYDGQCSFGEVERFLAERGYGLLTLYEVARKNFCMAWATACFQRVG